MRKAVVLISGLLFVGRAFPASVNYVLTSGADTIAFSITQPPTALACVFSNDCFSVDPVAVTIDGTTFANGTVSFYTSNNGGGLTILTGSTLQINDDGPNYDQLFSGTLASPTLEAFSNLQLSGETGGSPVYTDNFVLNASFSSAAVPEPSTALLVVPGGIFLALILRQRHRRRFNPRLSF